MITALIIIGSIVALFFLLALIMGKEMNIERSIIINKPIAEVFDYISHIRNQENFSVWMMMDSEMKKEYRGTDGTVGFICAWNSNKKSNAGQGEQEIKAIVPNQSVDLELRFVRPMQSVAHAKMSTEAVDSNQTKVRWGFISTMKFPGNVMKPMIEGMMVKNLDEGLNNLKNALEK